MSYIYLYDSIIVDNLLNIDERCRIKYLVYFCVFDSFSLRYIISYKHLFYINDTN